MHKLVLPDAGVTSHSHATGSDGRGDVVPEWQLAAGRLAAVTPLLVVGTDSYHEADMVERLKVRAVCTVRSHLQLNVLAVGLCGLPPGWLQLP